MNYSQKEIQAYLFFECFGPKINTAAPGALARLPWAGYEANAMGMPYDIKDHKAYFLPKVQGGFAGKPLAIEGLEVRFEQEGRGALSKTACVRVAQECLDCIQVFFKHFHEGKFDAVCGTDRKDMDLRCEWLEIFTALHMAPVAWLMALPHEDGICHYLEHTQRMLETVHGSEGQEAGKESEKKGQPSLVHRATIATIASCALAADQILNACAKVLQEREPQAVFRSGDGTVMDAILSVHTKLWRVHEERHRFNPKMQDLFGAFFQGISSAQEPPEQSGVREVFIFWSSTLKGEALKELRGSFFYAMDQASKESAWSKRALRALFLETHTLRPLIKKESSDFYEHIAAYRPQEELSGAILRKKETDIVHWTMSQKRNLKSIAPTMLPVLPLPVLYGMLNATSNPSLEQCITKHVQERFTREGKPLEEGSQEAAPNSLGNRSAFAWIANRTEWLQVLVGTAICKGNQNLLKEALSALDGVSVNECIQVYRASGLGNPLTLMEYNIKEPSHAWLAKWLQEQGVAPVVVKDPPSFVLMLEAWAADLQKQHLSELLPDPNPQAKSARL